VRRGIVLMQPVDGVVCDVGGEVIAFPGRHCRLSRSRVVVDAGILLGHPPPD
jgi:hypothetical protein